MSENWQEVATQSWADYILPIVKEGKDVLIWFPFYRWMLNHQPLIEDAVMGYIDSKVQHAYKMKTGGRVALFSGNPDMMRGLRADTIYLYHDPDRAVDTPDHKLKWEAMQIAGHLADRVICVSDDKLGLKLEKAGG